MGNLGGSFMEQQATQTTLELVILKLLDWPFLAFIILLLAIFLFRRQLAGIFGRGDILISWGENRNIRLRELSASLDEELDPIRDEINAIKKAVTVIESNFKVPNAPRLEPIIKGDLSSDQRDIAKQRMKEALTNDEYLWRSNERLAIIGGISESQALNILRADPEVVLSMGKSRRQIARLASRSR